MLPFSEDTTLLSSRGIISETLPLNWKGRGQAITIGEIATTAFIGAI